MHHLRIFTAALVALILSAFHAQSGDFAEFQSLGFSKDGLIYAFEQYGVQDGSGFPYAERFFINTADDTFVKGTPFKVRLEDEQATILAARQQVQEQSTGVMQQFGIGEEPGKLVTFNPYTETNANSKSTKYHANHYFRDSKPPFEAFIEVFEPSLPKGHDCIDYSLPVNAFGLKFKSAPEDAAQTIYQDTSVPKSRGCPQDYHMGGVVAFDIFGKPSVHVFLILVESFGFEGPDGRWIAIPKVLN